jgi:two-component system LytT family response regulator
VIRTLIVDDEPLARTRVAMLLARHHDITVIGEAADGAAARAAIAAQKPELVLLDIQMPGVTGIELLQSLPESARPLVVFLTAYDQHAVDAFDAAALDYALKPVDPKRLARALDRVRTQLAHAPKAAAYPDRFLVRKSQGRRIVVKTADVEWVAAERNYVRLHTANGSYLMREAISRIWEQLDPKRYARIHRSAIVNVECVKEIASDADGSLFVTMRGGQRLSVGETFRDAFEQLLGHAL